MKKPSFWPKNPYPESVFPMLKEQYLEIVPDPGMLERRSWDIASDAIWEAMLAAEDEWTDVWPTEPGRYWFFGWCWEYRNHKPSMILVLASETGSSIVYVGDGHFIYEDEGAQGLWKKAVLPEPPELSGELAQGGGGGEAGVVRLGG